MKICVYAISKDESKFVERWMRSMSEADQIVVLDTGSQDDTVAQLRALGAEVCEERIEPWRFDEARNRSLALVPENVDVCVCTDLDEVFHPGWRERLEQAWQPGTTQASYRYVWNFKPDGSEDCVFWIEKIHLRHGFRWKHPVHEVLEWMGEPEAEQKIFVEGIQLDHHADPSKSRGQYLPLLELSVREEPDDDRNRHYLGREYMYRGDWDRCIETLKQHLAMPQAVWADERSASMRYIGRACVQKGEIECACGWYLRAIAEAPYLREPMVELAQLMVALEDWESVVCLTGRALSISERPRSYICDGSSWGSLPWELRAAGLFHTGRATEAMAAAQRALELSPNDGRLLQNLEVIQASLGYN